MATSAPPRTRLLFLFRDLHPPFLFDHETRDPLVTLTRVDVGEHQEILGLARIGDPHLGPVENVVFARGVQLGRRLEGESV